MISPREEDESNETQNNQKRKLKEDAVDLEEEEEEEEDDDRFSTKGFNHEEISLILHNQEQDPFFDIIKLKSEAVDYDERRNIFNNSDIMLNHEFEAEEDSINQSRRELMKPPHHLEMNESSSSKNVENWESYNQSSSVTLNQNAVGNSSKFGTSTMMDDIKANGNLEKTLTFQGTNLGQDLVKMKKSSKVKNKNT